MNTNIANSRTVWFCLAWAVNFLLTTTVEGQMDNGQPVKPPFTSRFLVVNDPTAREAEYDSLRSAVNEPVTESLPPEQDPAGNWGVVTDGVQLSARLRRDTYGVGESVDLLVIYRNLRPASRQYVHEAPPYAYYEYILSLGTNIQTRSEPVLERRNFAPSHTYHVGPVEPRSQLVFVVRLNDWFNLKQIGEYECRVIRHELPAGEEAAHVTIASGRGRFKVMGERAAGEVFGGDYVTERIEELHKKLDAMRKRKSNIETNVLMQ